MDYTNDKRAVLDPDGERIGTGRTIAEAARIADAMTFAAYGRRLATTPSACSEALDEAELTEDQAEEISEIVSDSDLIYEAWHRSCELAYEDVVGEEYPPDNPDEEER